MPLAIGGTSQYGYGITKSLRFRNPATAYLNKTFSTSGTGAAKLWTWSAWVKRGAITSASYQELFTGVQNSSTTYSYIGFNTTDNLVFNQTTSSSSIQALTTSQVFRDPAAWYHIVVVYDSAQATAANRAKIYVNGTQVTAFSTSNYPAQNTTGWIGNSNAQYFGTFAGSTEFYDGYIAEVNFIDGQALTPTSFGAFNGIGGAWQPIKYTGTYGTNGFYLPFTNTTSTTTLGYDFSGNGNNWTTNNFSLTAGVTYDSMTDVPTLTSATVANYATPNPLDYFAYSASGVSWTLSNSNLTLTSNTTASSNSQGASIKIPSSGLFYGEVVITNFTISDAAFFWIQIKAAGGSIGYSVAYTGANAWGNYGYYNSYTATGTATSSISNGAVIMWAVDASTRKVWLGANNTWFNSGNPVAGTGQIGTHTGTDEIYFAFGGRSSSGATQVLNVNFGQRGFAYTPPTGYVALNTYNLPTSTIVAGNKYMDATLYTGTGSAQSITNTASFKPDLVWVKSRSNAYDHGLIDSVRGVGKYLFSDLTDAETTYADGFTSFNSNGFTIGGTGTTTNSNGATYVGWQWQAGQGSNSNNTSGTITSTVSVNQTAGFSVVGYTGNGSSSATVGHGLGITPSWIITKHRGDTSNWMVFHTSLSSGYNLRLNTTDPQAQLSGTTYGGISTSPTSTTFGFTSGTSGVDNSNPNGVTMIAYCWAAISGFSAFGSYTGNGSADGPFVYTGFRPKYVLYKRSDGGTESWRVLDTIRSPYNLALYRLSPNENSAEGTSAGFNNVDFVSNGFKVRSNSSDQNTNGATYIYAAFAENPFKYALAR